MAPHSESPTGAHAAHFGRFGGIFVPETLMAPLVEVADAYESARSDPTFQQELDAYAEWARTQLKGMAEHVHNSDLFHDEVMGHAGALVRHPDGLIEGAADPRSDGQAAGF